MELMKELEKSLLEIFEKNLKSIVNSYNNLLDKSKTLSNDINNLGTKNTEYQMEIKKPYKSRRIPAEKRCFWPSAV